LLDRLGRTSFTHRRLVGAVWALLLAAFAMGALLLGGPTATNFTIPGTESQTALQVLQERFPALGIAGASARVVVAAPEGETLDADDWSVIGSLVTELQGAPQVAMAVSPMLLGAVDPSGRMAYIQVSYLVPLTDVTDDARAALLAVAEKGRAAGLTVEVGGDALMEIPVVGGEEVLGVVVAAFVLVWALGSVIAAGLPLVMALMGVGIVVSAVGIMTHFMELTSFTFTLSLMLGLAVAIDYSLFIVSRYRHQLALGESGPDAIGRALSTAGSAVLFAGSTVVIALLALGVVGIPILFEVGAAAAFTVVVSVGVALTLLPALLGSLGERLRPAHDPESDSAGSGVVVRWARFVTARPVPVSVVASVALLILAIPATSLRLGLPDDGMSGADTTQRKAYDMLTAGFGPGVNGPLVVVVDARDTDDAQAALRDATATVTALPGVESTTISFFDTAGEYALFQVIPSGGPNSLETEQVVRAIRGSSPELVSRTGATLAVTGRTALNIDTSERLGDALVPYLLIVVGLSLLLLGIVFRSVLVPVKATVGFVLSLAATLGVVVAVFQWGWLSELAGIPEPGPILSLLPIIIVGVVFGLAMDYEVFLVTRMREEHARGAGPVESVVAGYGHGGRVVAAAAIIMISVFAGFVVSEDSMVKTVGFALAFAILFDAFVVRLTIVPAVMAILGERAWWLPGWLDRLLPNIHVEGEPAPAR
jgi:RND superfamily putative drug exporter